MIAILFFLLFPTLLDAHSATVSHAADLHHIDRMFDQKEYVIGTVTYKSDIYIDPDEFSYLVDFEKKTNITATDVKKSLSYLLHKNIFTSITISSETIDDTENIHLDLVGKWTFKALKVTGVWVGRDWYKQYYLMESGDAFDAQKHNHSLSKIRESAYRDGFFNLQTQERFSFDEKTKTIKVFLHLNRSHRFVCKNNTCIISGDIDDNEKNILTQIIHKKFIRHLTNTKYSKSILQEHARSIKQYLAYKGFPHNSIELTEQINRDTNIVSLEWNIDLHKKLSFVFFGNYFFTKKQILDRILAFGRSAWILPATILSQELVKMYHAKGFWNVSIDTEEDEGRTLFIIKEGVRAKINTISIHNTLNYTEQFLINSYFKQITHHAVFDKELLQKSFDALTAWYISQGFCQCTIISHEFNPLQANEYELVVTLDEGERSCINHVSIPTLPDLETKGPMAQVNTRLEETPCNPILIAQQNQWITNHCNQQGFLHAQVSHTIEKNDTGNTLLWHVNTGQKASFGKTIIQGSTTFPFKKVMQELTYHESEIWNSSLLKRSFLRLKDLQLFNTISFTPLSFSQDIGSRPVLLKLHHDDPFELRVRTGLEFQHIQQYQTFGGLTYKVGGTFIVKNPTNHGDQFRIDADVARSHRELRGTYRYPWVAGLPVHGTGQGYAIRYDQPGFIGSKHNLYTFFHHGFLLGLNHKNQHLDCGLNLGFEVARTRISDDDTVTHKQALAFARAIDFNPLLLNQRVPFIFIEPTTILNYLDTAINPSSGFFTLLTCKGMFPTNNTFKNSYFVKFLVEHSCFFSIKNVVSAWRLRFGHIFHRVFSDIMPSERFYLGGAHSIRSYESDMAPPLGFFIDAHDKPTLVARGGKTMINGNVEIRIPVYKSVGIVLFQDIGLLSGDNFIDFKPQNVVAGTGFGLRYLTPIGPLRFDMAWKWSINHPEERWYNWFLTFGQAF